MEGFCMRSYLQHFRTSTKAALHLGIALEIYNYLLLIINGSIDSK
jgi:hypothetical protein